MCRVPILMCGIAAQRFVSLCRWFTGVTGTLYGRAAGRFLGQPTREPRPRLARRSRVGKSLPAAARLLSALDRLELASEGFLSR